MKGTVPFMKRTVPGSGGAARGPLEPEARRLDLPERGEGAGAGPRAVQRVDAAGVDDRVAERAAELVLLHLQLEPEELLEHDHPRGLVHAPAVERAAQLGERRQDLLAD